MNYLSKYEKHISMLLSIAAIVLASLSYLNSKNVSEKSLNLEAQMQLREIAKNLKLKFRSDSLYFTTVKPCPDETQEEKARRLATAAIEIAALDELLGDRKKSLILFLKVALLAQQGDYRQIDKEIKKVDPEYKDSLEDMRLKYEICIPREEGV
ncbi:MAG: hypothetical protein RI556_03515 [Hydrogenovibrio sp.]|uniref:hypothetical protein n=1 Tax=Hydrogenovibrio sp. TaxID=2065821 RepID=UPI0028704D54|nr:hypothetical protein [Hydrogenovibrio sp.]MDR9498218.1 hypothetical protein [Hydrogenovibrio sp.]